MTKRGRYGGGYSWRKGSRENNYSSGHDDLYSLMDICLEDVCGYDGGASFDKNGNVLVPARDGLTYISNGEQIAASGDGMYWANDSLPSIIHPISCCYKVNIGGFEDQIIPDSPFRGCDGINGNSFYSSYDPYPTLGYDGYAYFPNEVVLVENQSLCSIGSRISSTYASISIKLSIGLDGIVFLDNTVFPEYNPPDNINDEYVYKSEKRQEEGRPQLYIWAIIEILSAPDENTSGAIPYSPPIYFKTRVGEFNGDYMLAFYNGTPYVKPIKYYTECYESPMSLYSNLPYQGSLKPYHGDLDLSNLSFYTSQSDLFPCHVDPSRIYDFPDNWPMSFVSIYSADDCLDEECFWQSCNLANVYITLISTQDQAENITDQCKRTNTIPFPIQKHKDRDIFNRYYFPWCYYGDYGGLIADHVLVELRNFASVRNYEEDVENGEYDNHACYDGEDLNREYRVIINYDSISYPSVGGADIKPVCCECRYEYYNDVTLEDHYQRGCITNLGLNITYDYDMYRDPKYSNATFKLSISVDNVSAYIFSYTIEVANEPDGKIDLEGKTFRLEFDPSSPGETEYDVSSASVLIKFPPLSSTDSADCVIWNEVVNKDSCENYGYKGWNWIIDKAPKQLQVYVPNCWENPDPCVYEFPGGFPLPRTYNFGYSHELGTCGCWAPTYGAECPDFIPIMDWCNDLPEGNLILDLVDCDYDSGSGTEDDPYDTLYSFLYYQYPILLGEDVDILGLWTYYGDIENGQECCPNSIIVVVWASVDYVPENPWQRCFQNYYIDIIYVGVQKTYNYEFSSYYWTYTYFYHFEDIVNYYTGNKVCNEFKYISRYNIEATHNIEMVCGLFFPGYGYQSCLPSCCEDIGNAIGPWYCHIHAGPAPRGIWYSPTCKPDIIGYSDSINQGPEITSTPTYNIVQGDTYIYNVEATDLDSEELTYSLTESPDGMTIDSSTGLIEWVTEYEDIGEHDVKIKVEDPNGLFDIQVYDLTVQYESGPQCTPWRSPASTGNSTPFYDKPWANTSNISSNDNDYTYVTPDGSPTKFLHGYNFGFADDIPAGATILGIQCTIIKQAETADIISDYDVRLVDVTGDFNTYRISNNQADGSRWDTSKHTSNYGGENNLWGLGSISRDTVIDGNFGIGITVLGGLPAEARIYLIQMRICYEL